MCKELLFKDSYLVLCFKITISLIDAFSTIISLFHIQRVDSKARISIILINPCHQFSLYLKLLLANMEKYAENDKKQHANLNFKFSEYSLLQDTLYT